MPYSRSVKEIQGVGPATERALNDAGFYFTADLLRLPAAQIHVAVARLASPEEVGRWQDMARLLEVAGMTGQWAEALVAAGANTFEELLAKDLDALRRLFTDAQASGVIPDVPADAGILQMVADATALFYTGHLAGTVVDDDGMPLTGARVTVDGLAVETDARGRFRIVRIPAADGHYLLIEHPGYVGYFDAEAQISHDHRNYASGLWRLDPGDGGLVELDEYDGDSLPALTSYKAVWQTVDEVALRESDVFRVHEHYASSPHVKLVSIFRAYRAGELIIRSAKVGLDRFGVSPDKGELYRLQGGDFVHLDGGPRSFEKHRALRKLRRDLALYDGFDALDPVAKIDWMFRAFGERYFASRLKTG